MATLPEGALMQRAAAGLASAVLEMLGRAYGSHVLLLVGAGALILLVAWLPMLLRRLPLSLPMSRLLMSVLRAALLLVVSGVNALRGYAPPVPGSSMMPML